jgi:hypothetical protein
MPFFAQVNNLFKELFYGCLRFNQSGGHIQESEWILLLMGDDIENW